MVDHYTDGQSYLQRTKKRGSLSIKPVLAIIQRGQNREVDAYTNRYYYRTILTTVRWNRQLVYGVELIHSAFVDPRIAPGGSWEVCAYLLYPDTHILPLRNSSLIFSKVHHCTPSNWFTQSMNLNDSHFLSKKACVSQVHKLAYFSWKRRACGLPLTWGWIVMGTMKVSKFS